MFRITEITTERYFTDEDSNFTDEMAASEETVSWRWDGSKENAPVYRPTYGPAYSITRISASKYVDATGGYVSVRVNGWPHTAKGVIDKRVTSPDLVTIVDPAFAASMVAFMGSGPDVPVTPEEVYDSIVRSIERIRA